MSGRREQVFHGWGEPGAGPSLPAHAEDLLRERLGIPGGVVAEPVALEAVRLREPALPDGLRAGLEAVVGAEHVRDDREIRVLRAAGKSYLDLIALRSGDALDAPDAVVAPATAAQVRGVLRACATAGVAVVPFGGGTSVVGGVAPERGPFPAVVSLDLGRMDRLVRVDRDALTAVFEPGIRLPEADRALAAHGLTLGHVPQSYEWATVGGCVATRSSGQASTGLGRIDANVIGVHCVCPAGDLEPLAVPATAAGPDLRELIAGSEGTLGVICSVTLRVHHKPASERYEGWLLRSFADGVDALRRMEQAGAAPDVVRLSDEAETELSLALAGGTVASLLRRSGRCLLVCGWLGEPESVLRRRASTARALVRSGAGALPLGRRPGDAWAHARFAGPHLRDDLLDRGVLTETLETACTWERVGRTHAAVVAALRESLGERAAIGCHVSHLYATGCSLYFTILVAQDREDPAGQWQRAKAAASDALGASGATITHHHAVGRDHARWLARETGALGADLLRVVKERCDPAGIMNPGKLLALD